MYQPSISLVLPGLSDSKPGLTMMRRGSGMALDAAMAGLVAEPDGVALGDGAPAGAAQPASAPTNDANTSQRSAGVSSRKLKLAQEAAADFRRADVKNFADRCRDIGKAFALRQSIRLNAFARDEER